MNPVRLDLDLLFSLDGASIQAINITYERFLRSIPSHSHGSGCYEIHYIPAGFGKLTADGHIFDITPNTLFVTGPHVEHAQIPVPADPMEEYCIYLKIRDSRRKTDSPVMNAFASMSFWFGTDTQGVHGLITTGDLHGTQLQKRLSRRPLPCAGGLCRPEIRDYRGILPV